MKNVRNQFTAGRIARASVAVISAAAFLYVIGCSPSTPGGQTNMVKFRQGDLAKLQVPGEANPKDPRVPELDTGVQPAPQPAPDLAITGPDGAPVKIADFKGKVVLVNLWATWCAPCKIEMPTLAALQRDYTGKPLAILAVSADTGDDIEKARAQIAQDAPLGFYRSNGIDLAYAFKPTAPSFPTTVIYDKKGVERARLPGEANWNGKDARALIDALLAEG